MVGRFLFSGPSVHPPEAGEGSTTSTVATKTENVNVVVPSQDQCLLGDALEIEKPLENGRGRVIEQMKRKAPSAPAGLGPVRENDLLRNGDHHLLLREKKGLPPRRDPTAVEMGNRRHPGVRKLAAIKPSTQSLKAASLCNYGRSIDRSNERCFSTPDDSALILCVAFFFEALRSEFVLLL